ncbi:MAG: hypothetical protein LWY06_03570 [Firmicutes bacterium]|nr:hypothetical protein [Bacillota bacterium]
MKTSVKVANSKTRIFQWTLFTVILIIACAWSGCGGGSDGGTTTDSTTSPTATSTATVSPTSTATATVTPTSTATATPTATVTPSGDQGDETDYSSITLASGGTYSSANSGATETKTEYTSTTADTNAIKVAPGGSLTLTNSKATKSGDTASAENSGFYGFNAGVLASSSSSSDNYTETNSTTTLTMTNCTITTTSVGSNGAFAFGQGAVVNLDHVTINTTGGNNARGVDATYGGTVNVTNSVITTKGDSCAALATDRYNGATAPKINATNCTGTTAGSGSPGIYCTGTFVVKDCTLSATGSEAAVIEGKNSITLTNTSISGVKKWGVMIYQSMSGDSSTGTGNFSMTGGTLTNGFSSGPAFFVCDTDAVIKLVGATIKNSSDMLLLAGKASTASTYIDNVNSSWGTLGGNVTFTAENQTLEGKIIICDSSSSIDLTLTNSNFKGSVNTDKISCTAKLTIDSGSTWEVTGDSYLTSLTNNGTISGSGKVYVNGVQVY